MYYSVLSVSLLFLLGYFFIPLEAVVEEYLDPTINPCENFHQYACGKWSKVHPSVQNGDTLSLLDATINEKISGLLESEQEQGVLKKVKAFYESCRNLEVYDMGALLNVAKCESDWAVSSSWNPNKFNWLQTIAELRKYGLQVFFEVTILPRWDSVSTYALYMDILKIKPSSEESLKAILQKASLNYSLIEEFTAFEKQLAQIIPSSDESAQEDDWEEVVIGYLTETSPQIDWVKYFSALYGHEIDLSTSLIVQNLELMSKLAEFLDASPKKTVSNYIMIKFLQFLDQFGIKSISPNECVTGLHQSMPLAVDHVIENNFYELEYDQVVQDLFNYLKVEFLVEVSKLYENQRDVLLFIYTKASAMDLQIGNSDRNMTTKAVTKYYEHLEINEDNFYLNFLEALKFKTKKDFNLLKGEPINIAHQWTVSPIPFFLQPKNKIVIPLSLLQEGIFAKDTTNKFSVLGFIIAHEFLHGFDMNGVNYDYTGSMVESALSHNPSFFERIQCIHELMGPKGIGEKIADFGAIRLAYNSFQRSLNQIGQDIMETNKETARPLKKDFFIDFAQVFCGKTEKTPRGFIDVHDPDEERIKGSLKNFNTFADTFQCPVGSVMNPEKKCRVW